jgi:ribosome-binding protein aMBF1 (putative translation factor)
MVKRIEHGYIPSIKIAHKLEKVIHVKLTEMVSEESQDYSSGKSGGTMTLGDIITIKKEKR